MTVRSSSGRESPDSRGSGERLERGGTGVPVRRAARFRSLQRRARQPTTSVRRSRELAAGACGIEGADDAPLFRFRRPVRPAIPARPRHTGIGVQSLTRIGRPSATAVSDQAMSDLQPQCRRGVGIADRIGDRQLLAASSRYAARRETRQPRDQLRIFCSSSRSSTDVTSRPSSKGGSPAREYRGRGSAQRVAEGSVKKYASGQSIGDRMDLTLPLDYQTIDRFCRIVILPSSI